jgi:hypothetical protein
MTGLENITDDDMGEFSERFDNPPAGGLLSGAKSWLSEPPPPVYWH